MKSLSLLLSLAYLITVICCALDILKTRRASGGAAIWLFVVIIVPFGIFAYIFFGDSQKEKRKKETDLWDADAELKKKANSGTLE